MSHFRENKNREIKEEKLFSHWAGQQEIGIRLLKHKTAWD